MYGASTSSASQLLAFSPGEEHAAGLWETCLAPGWPHFGIVNKAEIDVFQELSCFFDDPADVGFYYFKERS